MEAPTAQELVKLVSSALEAGKLAGAGDAAEQERALDALKLLAKQTVTAALLRDTEAGKRINKLCKHTDAQVAAAATHVVQSWKNCVRREQESKPAFSNGVSNGSSGQARPAAASTPPGARTSSAAGATPDGRKRTPPPSAAAPAPAKPSYKPPPQTGDRKRDNIRTLFGDSLALALDKVEAGAEPGKVAAMVEELIFQQNSGTTAAYIAKVRQLTFNLKDPSNPDLRSRVLAGIISPEQLMTMTADELASDKRREENERLREHAKWEAVRNNTQQASTDQFQCGKCKQFKTTYYQMQTRSADEPMTTFVTCTNCGNKWKFC